ncbi:hypothetical protein [Botrimarina mediterranea]|uniref:Uncharacterized protein n=1 Tax=Botrimarina mediterranea TaxID=2528022 RepID=A0A518K6Z7_9BACT|nr:hypothetical protein [Botrimarina mediterranea]QDV73569.1 hypothetical protein Spa11_17670 [Botrimarina mediterranea]QDV78160.1 hypothetical protein K2D_17660 [Planctomycetes bacterium K2D]
MSGLAEQLLTAIDATPRGGTATAADGEERLSLGVSHADGLAVAFTELRLETPRLKDATVERVRAVAEKLTQRVTYLLEALTPVEIDRELAVVQLRSTTPQQDNESSAYYELLVRTGGALSLRRYRKPRGAMREPIDATVTREVLARLVSDFVIALS